MTATASSTNTPGRYSKAQRAVGRRRGVRHELRNALSAASLHLELLARGRRPEVELDRIEAVRDALDQALGLSDRLTTDTAYAGRATSELALLVRQCARLARPTIEQRGELVQSLPGHIGEIALDHIEGREVILNLLLNAGQALRPGGRVRVSARVGENGAFGEVTVADDGIGMSRETLEHAFEPGFTSKPGGTGYGLARVRELVLKANGQVRIQSTPTNGTRVTVELPLVGRGS